ESPGDVDVVGIARPPRGDDRDVIESVCPAALLAAADLYLHWPTLRSFADEKTPHCEAENAVLAGIPRSLTNAPPRITAVKRPPGRPIMRQGRKPSGDPGYTVARASSSRDSTLGSRRPISAGSTLPAPKCSVDSAPQATAKRRHSSGGRPSYRAATKPARKASPEATVATGSTGGAVTS